MSKSTSQGPYIGIAMSQEDKEALRQANERLKAEQKAFLEDERVRAIVREELAGLGRQITHWARTCVGISISTHMETKEIKEE